MEAGLCELRDDRLPGRPLGAEERRTEHGHAGDHRHRRPRDEVGSCRSHPPDVHALGADPAEDGHRPLDLADSGIGQLLFAHRLRSPQREDEPAVLDEQVVQPADELRGQLLLVGFLGNDRHPRLAEVVDETREGHDERLAKERGLRTEVAEQQVLGDAGRLRDLLRGRAAVVLPREELPSRVEQQPTRLTPGPARRLALRGRLRGGRLPGCRHG